MTGTEHRSNNWPDLSTAGEYGRLVWLAKRRLVGHEYHAEDVVSRALMKWQGLPDRQRAVGRIEQVIKSEAYSLLRSENRARERERRVAADRSEGSNNMEAGTTSTDLRLLREAIAQTCKREGITLTNRDVEFVELLLAGLNLSEAQRSMKASRHEVRKLRDKWRRVLRQTLTNDMVS
ncbi:MAG: hypothetical protein AAFN30_06040 [Actinomycetota bacterium]